MCRLYPRLLGQCITNLLHISNIIVIRFKMRNRMCFILAIDSEINLHMNVRITKRERERSIAVNVPVAG